MYVLTGSIGTGVGLIDGTITHVIGDKEQKKKEERAVNEERLTLSFDVFRRTVTETHSVARTGSEKYSVARIGTEMESGARTGCEKYSVAR